MRINVARLSGVRRRSVNTLVAPMGRRSRISANSGIVAHGQPFTVDHRQGKARALQQRTEFAHIGERRNARRHSAFDLALRRGEGLAQFASDCRHRSVRPATVRPASARGESGSASPGKSLTNCSASADTTRSSEPSANGNASSSAATCRNEPRPAAGDRGDERPTLPLACEHAAHRIGRRAEIDGDVELAQHRSKPLAQVLCNAVEQKSRRRQACARALARSAGAGGQICSGPGDIALSDSAR